MGKNKKGYNWRARTNISGDVDNSETQKLANKIDPKLLENETDLQSSNALILPSKKRKFKASKENESVGKILSKKKRKHLEKIVERKKKKEERGDLLEKLGQVQADEDLLNKMVSLSSVQTKGLKRQFAEEEWKERLTQSGINIEQVVVENEDDIELPKKIKLRKPKKIQEEYKDDPNVLGFEQSSSSEDESEDEDVDDIDEKENIE